MEIRKLLPNDLRQILEISQTSFKEPWQKSDFEKYFDCSFVADDNGEIAGFVVGKIAGNKGILKLIAVNPDFRGKGVGKSLMEHTFKFFGERGVKEVVARSRLHNEAGCAFLKSFGFEIIKTIENYYHDGESAYLMKRELWEGTASSMADLPAGRQGIANRDD